MRKAMYLSGVFTVVLLSLLLTGWADTDDSIKKALRLGNLHYELADYEEALISYETGLAANLENKPLNFNAAQTAYLLGEYEKAAEYYEKSEDCEDKFLNAGNIYLRSGDAVEDEEQKAQYYIQALSIYQEGIAKFPRNIPLKYNYEIAKEKVEELLENSEQESDEQKDGDDDQENQEQKSESEQESEGEESSEAEQASEGEESSDEEQAPEGEESSDEEQESEGEESSDEEQASEDEEGSEEEHSQATEQEDSEENQSELQDEGDEQQEAYSQNEEENTMEQEAIERILQMLEIQEEQSLKNNQEVVGGNEGKYGW